MVKRIYLVSFLKQSAPYVFKPIDNLPIIRDLGKSSVIVWFRCIMQEGDLDMKTAQPNLQIFPIPL